MTFDPLQLLAVLAAALGYAWRCGTLARRRRAVPAARRVWFSLGIVLLIVAFVSPLSTSVSLRERHVTDVVAGVVGAFRAA